MALATLTKSGRAAIASAIAARPLHLAWGIGLEEWDAMTDEELPSLVERTELFNEIGRRVSSWTGFAEPDEKGGIVVPTGTLPDSELKAPVSKFYLLRSSPRTTHGRRRGLASTHCPLTTNVHHVQPSISPFIPIQNK